MNSSAQIIYGTWSPSSTINSIPSYPAPVHWTMSQLDNIPPPPYYSSQEGDYKCDDEEYFPSHVEAFAKSMFWWGFGEYRLFIILCSNAYSACLVCPLFWLAGTLLIFSKLRAPSDWDEEKTPRESMRILQLIREAELRWAWRSAYALSILVLVAVFLFLIIKFSILSR
jgi:hypothetical protein